MYNLNGECDGIIFKPQPKKDNIFIHVDWVSDTVPKATTNLFEEIILKNRGGNIHHLCKTFTKH